MMRRNSLLLQSGENISITMDYHTLMCFQATRTTPLNGVVFYIPMYSMQVTYSNALIYTRYLFSPVPNSPVLIRSINGDYSFNSFIDTTAAYYLIPEGDYWIESASSSVLHISTFLSFSWNTVVDSFLLSNSPQFIPLHHVKEGLPNTVINDTPSLRTLFNLQLQEHNNPIALNNITEFYYTDVNWELTVQRKMRPRVPVLINALSSVMCDTLPKGLEIDPETGTVYGTPESISSQQEYVMYVEGLQGRVKAKVSIAVHPPTPDDDLDAYRGLIVAVFIVVLIGLGWLLLNVIIRHPSNRMRL